MRRDRLGRMAARIFIATPTTGGIVKCDFYASVAEWSLSSPETASACT
jgi:hypothetical protein